MKLVWKITPRGKLHRELNFVERTAIQNVYGRAHAATKADEIVAKSILQEMDVQKFWLECDCLVSNEQGPFNCEVKSKLLRHVHSSPQHDPLCPLYRVKKDKDGSNSEHEGKTSPLNPIGGNDWLPVRQNTGNVSTALPAREPTTKRQKALKPVPALGRKLLTLIQVAGLNQLELIPKNVESSLFQVFARMKDILLSSTMENGTPLSDLMCCSPWLNTAEIGDKIEHLSASETLRGSNFEFCFYVVGLTKHVTHEEITFDVKKRRYSHRPAGRVCINGENSYNAGSRAPYWVILEFRKDKKGDTYCHEGYAHAAYSLDNPVPVDSNKERETLKVILSASDFVGKKPNAPEAISLLKPLFTLKSGRNADVVHPDFILNIIPPGKATVATIIVETMGNESEDYILRKAVTHEQMSHLGDLITDPPGWPEPSDISFNSLLLSHIFKAGKR